MEFDLFSIIAVALGAWVLISPCWRLPNLRRQRGSLEDTLLEGGEVGHRSGVNLWLPSWFALSVAVSLFWSWYYWGGSNLVSSPGTWLWADLNEYIIGSILFTLVINSTWLVWLSIVDFDYKRTLFCVAIGILAFMIVSAVPVFWKAKRFYCIGVIAILLTGLSNLCRVMSLDELQYAKFAISVAAAGVIAGLLWIVKAFVIDQFRSEMKEYGFWNVLFKKNFFWKASLVLGSVFRLRDAVLLLIKKAGEKWNLQEKKEHCWRWIRRKVSGSPDDGQT